MKFVSDKIFHLFKFLTFMHLFIFGRKETKSRFY